MSPFAAVLAAVAECNMDMDTNFGTRLNDDNEPHPSLRSSSSLSCPNSKSGIRSSVRSYAPLRFFFILIPFPYFLPIYLSRHSDCHHHRSHPRRLLLLHSERQSDARFATSRLTCSPHRGSFAATCSPSANAAAAFSASLASVSICSSASRSRCC